MFVSRYKERNSRKMNCRIPKLRHRTGKQHELQYTLFTKNWHFLPIDGATVLSNGLNLL